MSINTLATMNQRRPFHVADDVESLIYVIFYCAIHFLPWNNYSSIPHREINTFFFHQHGSNGTGGVGKRANLWIGDIFASAKFEFVSDWLAKFFVLMRSYAMPDMKASSKEVFDAYSGIFDREDAYWSGLPTSNRQVNKLPRTGQKTGIISASTVSSSRQTVTPPPAQPLRAQRSK
ncbi:hypothetical protein BDN70DRAFT_583045 [Pholiota conissans]|uniref:Fungal-type protein kinase domain-containing protein n=1 Tax=Pholiota conissans TaxID=109636 RepID=A0A9P6CM37_9AGAR|nr:hypothetical protein BDN70DRAFT_583045 [Pholiota conissans]